MKLTKSRRELLLFYQGLQGKRPTINHILRRYWRQYPLLLAVLAVLFTMVVTLTFVHQLWEFCFLSAGMIVGALARDAGYVRLWRRNWPLVDAIIDWNRVDELLAQSEESTAPPSA